MGRFGCQGQSPRAACCTDASATRSWVHANATSIMDMAAAAIPRNERYWGDAGSPQEYVMAHLALLKPNISLIN